MTTTTIGTTGWTTTLETLVAESNAALRARQAAMPEMVAMAREGKSPDEHPAAIAARKASARMGNRARQEGATLLVKANGEMTLQKARAYKR